MIDHRYHKKTKRERRRNRRIRILSILLIAAGICGCCVFFLLRERRQNRNSGYEYAEAASDAGDGVITYNGKKYVPDSHLSNYLFLGIDSSTSLSDSSEAQPGEGGQADAIYLVSYDRAEKTRKTFAIPRDSMTEIETFSPAGNSMGFARNHLSLQYAYGDGKRESCRLMETAVSKLLMGLEISGYTAINLESIPHLTELVGYVDVTVPDDSLASADPAFKKGATVRLTPNNTEFYVRSRDTGVSQSALTRMNRQMTYITAFANRVKELQAEDSSTVTRVYEGLSSYMVTDMTSDLFLNLEQAKSRGSIETIPGKGTEGLHYDEYEIDQDGLYEMMIRNFYQEA